MKEKYLERVLFVVAGRHCGKSTQLRSMFRDVRLGMKAEIPKDHKLKDFHRLTNESFLYLRLSSPHELKESPREFLSKTKAKIDGAGPEWGRRWNFACALQAEAANKMPDSLETVESFVECLEPERTRVAFPNPGRSGKLLSEEDVLRLSRRLHRVPSVEVCWIDGRVKADNGLLPADFFAF